MKHMSKFAFVLFLLMISTGYAFDAHAETVYEDEEGDTTVDVGAAVKVYAMAIHQHLPADALHAFGMDTDSTFRFLDTRLWLGGKGRSWKFMVMGQYGMADFSSPPPPVSTGTSMLTGFSLAPQVNSLPLQYYAGEDRGAPWFIRLDRIYYSREMGPFSLTVGRQPISFGTAFIWQPMDLVGPFSPYTIDREWKPGVDAARLDWAPSSTSEMSLVAVAGGEPCIQYDTSCVTVLTGHFVQAGEIRYDSGLSTVALRGRFALWGADIGFLAGYVRGDGVLGLFFSYPWKRWSLRGEATLTRDLDDADYPTYRSSFLRGVLGVGYSFSKGQVAMEVYHNGYGTGEYGDFPVIINSYRTAVVGEVVNLGRWYTGIMARWEPSARVTASSVLTVNLTDPSFLAQATVSLALTDESSLDAGGFIGYGRKSSVSGLGLDMRSEFGAYPWTLYVSYRRYF